MARKRVDALKADARQGPMFITIAVVAVLHEEEKKRQGGMAPAIKRLADNRPVTSFVFEAAARKACPPAASALFQLSWR